MPSATPSATASSAAMTGTSGGGVDSHTVIIVVAAIVAAIAAVVLLGWIARLKGIWPFHLLTPKDADFEDEMYAQQPATMPEPAKPRSTRPEIDYRRSTLVPAPMASPLYQVDGAPALPLEGNSSSSINKPQTDRHSRYSIRTASHASLGPTLLALPPQEMLPPMPETVSKSPTMPSSSRSGKMSSAFPADQRSATSASMPADARRPPLEPSGGSRDSAVFEGAGFRSR
ncbi:hypothetical protein HDU87_004601 [Geranomyces variabilis]|uniref:Uncharacterized protein n=1 Tax=Geranomyces variabilis TaxID=109894 RepID=A0AAD5XPS0_9FUNG|nr:hypothetical protein HDU87_004601 [Geranomyces variabilis]